LEPVGRYLSIPVDSCRGGTPMKKRLLSVRASGLVLIAAWLVLGQVAGALITDTRAATEELNQQAECPAPETPPPPGIPVLCFNARASAPGSVEAGRPFAVDVVLENAAGTDANNLIVDIEITNQAGSRVAQHYLYDRLLVGESKSYTAEFT